VSDHSSIAIILSSIKRDVAISVLEQSLAVLSGEFQFGFRGRGNVLRLVFEGQKYKWQDKIAEVFTSVSELDSQTLTKLVKEYGSFAVAGSIRVPNSMTLYNLDLILYPTFSPENPVCIVFRLDSSLYYDVYGEDDEFDQSAADTLLGLTVRLGANDQVEGFQMLLVQSLADIKTFSGLDLRGSLLGPAPIQGLVSDAGLPHGFVTGIKASILSLTAIGKVWKDGRKIETVNGFSVLDDLIEIDDSDSDDEND
jgi:hypothetical protein